MVVGSLTSLQRIQSAFSKPRCEGNRFTIVGAQILHRIMKVHCCLVKHQTQHNEREIEKKRRRSIDLQRNYPIDWYFAKLIPSQENHFFKVLLRGRTKQSTNNYYRRIFLTLFCLFVCLLVSLLHLFTFYFILSSSPIRDVLIRAHRMKGLPNSFH